MNRKRVISHHIASAIGQQGIRLLCAGIVIGAIQGQAVAEPAEAVEVAGADLVIHAKGFAHAQGQAIASLFRQGDDVFKKPFLRVRAKIDQEQATLVFPHMEFGNYAAIVFHDENGNDDLDHNALRFPAEPLGYSNGFRLGLFTGLPNFERLEFAFSPDAKPIEITVK